MIVALLTKIIGCGLAAKLCRFSWSDSLKVGVGMMTRGEVALIVAQKGLGAGVVDSVYFNRRHPAHRRVLYRDAAGTEGLFAEG